MDEQDRHAMDRQARILDAHAASLPVRVQKLKRALVGAETDNCINTVVYCADLRALLEAYEGLAAALRDEHGDG